MFHFNFTIARKEMLRFKIYWFIHAGYALFLILILIPLGLFLTFVGQTAGYDVPILILAVVLISFVTAKNRHQEYPFQQTWVFNDSFIKVTYSITPSEERTFKYSSVKNIKAIKGDVFISMNANGIIFLPSGAFRDAEERKDFLQFIQAKVQERANAPVSVSPEEDVYSGKDLYTEKFIYRFDIHISPEEYIAFSDYCYNQAVTKIKYVRFLKKHPRLRTALLIILFLFSSILAFSLSLWDAFGMKFFAFILLFYSLMLFLLVFSSKQRRTDRMKKTKKNHLPYYEQQTIGFHDAWFCYSSPDSQGKSRYDALKKAEVTSHAVYLFTDRNKAYILPFCCFKDQKQREDFIQFITAKIAEAAQEDGHIS